MTIIQINLAYLLATLPKSTSKFYYTIRRIKHLREIFDKDDLPIKSILNRTNVIRSTC